MKDSTKKALANLLVALPFALIIVISFLVILVFMEMLFNPSDTIQNQTKPAIEAPATKNK